MHSRRGARPGRVHVALSLALALGVLPAASAHDIWLQADSFTPSRGETLVVRQLVGEELDADLSSPGGTTELPVLRDMTPRFELLTVDGAVDLLAELPGIRERPEVRPVLSRTVDFDGLALVTMEHSILYTEHTDKEFLEYLEHEGLDPEDYLPQMEAGGFQTEGYARTLKSLVRAGETAGSAAVHGRPLGLSIEIVLLQNPYELDPGDTLEVQVLFRGEPLPGRTLTAFSSDGEGSISRRAVKIDEGGGARIGIDRAGLWLLRLVHLATCSPRSQVDCSDTTWESYWTSYTFEVD